MERQLGHQLLRGISAKTSAQLREKRASLFREREENDSHRSPARNEPASDNPKLFKGKAVTYYRGAYKFEETARRGQSRR